MTSDIPAASLGYRMPAEWEPHAATWLAWPHNEDTWPRRLPQVREIFLAMTEALHQDEMVHLLVDDAAAAEQVGRLMQARGIDAGSVSLHEIPTADAWLRDSGPIFLTGAAPQPPLAASAWRFNAWGGKYDDLQADAGLSQRIASCLGVPCFEPGIVLEGGAIDVNGSGACLTTEQCLLHPNRNPELPRADIERHLGDTLGVCHVIWLGRGIVGDDTDGHVDDVARFVGPSTVVCALETDPQDANFAPLQDNFRRLQAATDGRGRPLDVVPLPMPGRVGSPQERLPASYANFYIGNGVVLVPTYDHPDDDRALGILRDLLPGRRVVGISCEPLVWGRGAIHCVTQQQPAIAGKP
jgi:agmatine deiminase